MKIAVVHNLPAGGQKRAINHQVKMLSLNHTIDLFTLSTANETYLPLKPFIRNHTIFEYVNPPHFPGSVASIYFFLPKVYKKMAEKIDNGGYDAVYVNPCFLTQAPYVLSYLKTPSVYYCPEPKREFYEKIPHVSNFWRYLATYPFRLPLKNIDRDNAKKATKILTNSNFSKKRVNAFYGVNSFVNYLGADTDLFRPAKVNKENAILSVGELSLHKGHDFIIRSLSFVPSDLRPKLIIAGHGGSEKRYLTRLAESMGVRLEMKEGVSDLELVNIYNKVLVFVYASHNEPFGMVLLEALACGLPVLAVDEGGVKEIIKDNLLGVLTERDEKEFAKKLIEILRQAQDDGGNKQGYRKKRHEWVVKNWSWRKSVMELEKHLKEVTK